MKKMIMLFVLIFTFSAFSSDKTKTITLNISGMTCESCAGTVEKALKKVDGVKEAKVDLKNKKATITMARTITSAKLIKAVSDAGFSANDGKSAPKTEKKTHSKSEGKNCDDGCCGEDGEINAKQTKGKRIETKKS